MTDADHQNAARAKNALMWIVSILAALAMGFAGASKFIATEMWNALFLEWGYSIGFKTVIGVLEMVGAIAVLFPRFATYGAVLVCVIMLGAIYTVVVNQSDLGLAANTGNLILFAIIGFVRRHERWTPAG